MDSLLNKCTVTDSPLYGKRTSVALRRVEPGAADSVLTKARGRSGHQGSNYTVQYV